MCCQPGLQGGPCRGGQPQEAELWEGKQSKLEIPRRSSPLTYLLFSLPNLLTLGKGESLQFACFSRFPLSPALLPALLGCPWPQHRERHRLWWEKKGE